jgi:hypothetical protein
MNPLTTGVRPCHRNLRTYESQRLTAGQKYIGQQLVARQSGQVQTPGKGIDTGG